MHFTALRRFDFFHCSPPHSFQSEKYKLTWDEKCEKLSVLFSLTEAQRWYSGFQVTGMIEWGQKRIKTPKDPWTKIYLPKNPVLN